MRSISIYHWHILVYLAWMSSNVHLTTLTVIRSYVQNNGYIRAGRITGMTALLFLLLSALIPLASKLLLSLFSEYAPLNTLCTYQQQGCSGVRQLGPGLNAGDPVTCFWNPRYMEGINPDSAISLLLLLGSYTWKVAALHKHSSTLLREWLREKPERSIFRSLKRLAMWRSQWPHKLYLLTSVPFSWLLGTFALCVAFWELAESFFASILLLTGGLLWGTVQNYSWQSQSGMLNESQEMKWSFGQVMPMLLLVLPLITMLEEFSGKEAYLSAFALSVKLAFQCSTVLFIRLESIFLIGALETSIQAIQRTQYFD